MTKTLSTNPRAVAARLSRAAKRSAPLSVESAAPAAAAILKAQRSARPSKAEAAALKQVALAAAALMSATIVQSKAGARVAIVPASKAKSPTVRGDIVAQLTGQAPAPVVASTQVRLSAPPADMRLRIDPAQLSRIRSGFTAEMLAAIVTIVGPDYAGTFTRADAFAAFEGSGHSRAKLLDAFYDGTKRGVYVPAR